jgi:two-component system, sensor histidine kinase and response regulator
VHDLKNPVNSVDLQAQLLARIPDLPERALAPIARIRNEARVQLRLILNLLDISKSEEGRLEPVCARVDLDALVPDVLAALELRASDGSVSLAAALEVHAVWADPDLLLRVLENLVENAIRHAPEDTVVRVVSRAMPGGVELRVEDAGVGIPPDAHERVFDRYVQLGGDHSSSRSSRGLGLPFCKHAVLAHRGRIHVEDAAPGAAFCVFLPEPERGVA